jgi:glucan phosphoethanolaminetransferase (alkaline phosphatase superfamily)
MAIKILLMVIACFISGWSFFIYNRSDLKGKSHPKLVTWSLLALIVILNVTSYKLANDNIFVTLFPAANAVMTVLTFFFLLFSHIKKGNELKWPDKKDIVILITVTIVIVVVIMWQNATVATLANIATQICSGIAFIPTLLRLQDEDPRPWFMWSASFLLILAILLLNQQKELSAWFYPFGGMVGHFIIGVISSIKRRKARKVS